MAQFGLRRPLGARVPGHGRERRDDASSELEALAAEADLLVNISGHLTLSRGSSPPFRRRALRRHRPRLHAVLARGGPDDAGVAGTTSTSRSARTSAARLPDPDRRHRLASDSPAGRARRLAGRRRADADRFTTVASWRGAVRPGRARRARPTASRSTSSASSSTCRSGPRQRFEIALDIHPADDEDLRALRDHGWQLVDPRAGRRRSGSRFAPTSRVGRRVLGRPGHLRRDRQRLVQRPHGPLPGLGQAGARAGHRLHRQLPGRGGPARFRTLEEAAARVRGGSPPTSTGTRPRRGRSPKSASTPNGPAQVPREALGHESSSAFARPAPGLGRRLRSGRPVSRSRPLTRSCLSGLGRLRGIRGMSFSVIRLPRRKPLGDLRAGAGPDVGREEMVFDWSRMLAEPRDIPDAPARAFRDATGQVNLVASPTTQPAIVARP